MFALLLPVPELIPEAGLAPGPTLAMGVSGKRHTQVHEPVTRVIALIPDCRLEGPEAHAERGGDHSLPLAMGVGGGSWERREKPELGRL